jgi:hypothetical protein
VERDSRLFTEGDFDWSEPPRRRRRITEAATPARRRAVAEPIRTVDEPIRATRRSAVLEYEYEYEPELLDAYEYEASSAYEPLADDVPPARSESWDQPTASHSHFDEMMEQWNASYGAGARRDSQRSERVFDLSDPGAEAAAQAARRTVLITGRGDERYMPAPRRPRSSELRFHERSGFSPDRAGLWAVLLGIALVIGAVAH